MVSRLFASVTSACARRPRAASAAIIVAAAVAFMAPALTSDRVYAGDDLILERAPQSLLAPPGFPGTSNPLAFDAAYVFHPDLIAARRMVREGHLPTWTRYAGGGRPLIASQQPAPLYPPNGLAYVGDFWSSLEWTALVKLLVAGFGMVFALRALGLGYLASTFGAVSFMLSTALLVWFGHPHSNVHVLVPWLLGFAARTAARARPADAAGLAGALGLAFLGGHPQTVLLAGTLLVAPLALAIALWQTGEGLRSPRSVAGRLGLLVAGVVVGAAAGAIMLLPFAEALGASTGSAERGGTWIAREAINAFFFPELWGRPDRFVVEGGPSNFQERTAYFGMAPLLLAFGGLVARRPTVAQLSLVATVVLGLLLAFEPSVSEAAHGLPGFSSTNLWRSIVIVAIAGTVLSAFGAQRLLDGTRGERIRLLAVVAVVGLAIPGQWLVRHPGHRSALGDALGHLPSMSSEPALPAAAQLGGVLMAGILGAAVVAAAAIALWRRSLGPPALAVVLALTAVNLIGVGRGHVPVVPRENVDLGPSQTISFLAARAREGQRGAGDVVSLAPNLSNRFEVLDPRAHSQPPIERFNLLWLGLGGGADGNTQQRAQFSAVPETDRLLDTFSVRWLTSLELTAQPPREYRSLPEIEDTHLWENLDAHPRARFVSAWRPADEKIHALVQVIESSSEEIRDRPAIENVPQGQGSWARPLDTARSERQAAPSSGLALRARPARIAEETDTRVSLDVDAPEAGYLVLNDMHYPGWKAKVDGEDAEIHPANVAFRAVAVPAGSHRVEFRYAPASVRWGLVLTILAWVLIWGVALGPRARRALAGRRARAPEPSGPGQPRAAPN